MAPPVSARPSARRWPWRLFVTCALGYAAATILLTWPLFRHPGHTVLEAESLYGGAHILIQRDINLTMWVLSWDTHALTTNPTQLYHGNIFHPAPFALARSEHMLGNVPLFGPIFLATGNPVLAHQLTLLATFVLAGLAMAAYVAYWTDDRVAAVVAGVLYAFAPFRLWQLGNLHVISIHALPAVLLAIDVLLDRRRTLVGMPLLGLGLTISGLCSHYVGYQAFFAGGVYALGGLVSRGRQALPAVPTLLVPTVLAATAIGLLALPYLWLQHSDALPNYGDSRFTSLAFLSLMTEGVAGTLAFFVLPKDGGIPLFLTYTALVLATVGVTTWRRPPRGSLLALLLTGVVLALGPRAASFPSIPLPYEWLQTIVPGFSAMRAPQRFGVLATLAVAPLAGFGLARLRQRLATRPGGTLLGWAVAGALLAAFALEVTPPGLSVRKQVVGRFVPSVDRHLSEYGDGGAVLYLPLRAHQLFRESAIVYRSIFHWLPVVNGYSSYPPATYRTIAEATARLPAPDALRDVLRLARPRWVVLLPNHLPPGEREQWQTLLDAELRLVRRFNRALLYEVPTRQSASLRRSRSVPGRARARDPDRSR